METHEYYPRQHQDVRIEDGIEYGDVIEKVDFDYAAKLTAINVAILAGIAWAPPAPGYVDLRGGNSPAARVSWPGVEDR
jgi:hypothetical protein